MINTEKKQLVEMGELFQKDLNGSYRTGLRNRVIALRQETQERIRKELDREKMFCLEAMMRALMIADRILDKVLVEKSHEMSESSRAI